MPFPPTSLPSVCWREVYKRWQITSLNRACIINESLEEGQRAPHSEFAAVVCVASEPSCSTWLFPCRLNSPWRSTARRTKSSWLTSSSRLCHQREGSKNTVLGRQVLREEWMAAVVGARDEASVGQKDKVTAWVKARFGYFIVREWNDLCATEDNPNILRRIKITWVRNLVQSFFYNKLKWK